MDHLTSHSSQWTIQLCRLCMCGEVRVWVGLEMCAALCVYMCDVCVYMFVVCTCAVCVCMFVVCVHVYTCRVCGVCMCVRVCVHVCLHACTCVVCVNVYVRVILSFVICQIVHIHVEHTKYIKSHTTQYTRVLRATQHNTHQS